MSLLVSFVSFLNAEEIKRLRTMPLAGKEKLLLDVLLIRPGSGNKLELMRHLNLSSSHFDKISALVLKKSFLHFAGDDELEQLNFLSKKFMFHHLFHEIRQLRTKLRKQPYAKEKQERYLRSLFDFSINVPARYYDEKFVQENAREYLSCVSENRDERELEVKSKILFARLNLLTQQSPDPAAIKKIEEEMKETERQYRQVKDPQTKAILYHAWVNFYRMVKPDYRQRKKNLDKIARLYGGVEKMPEFERALASCHEAEMLFERNEFDAAYLAYSRTLTSNFHLLRNQFHHFARWIELAIILEHYRDAERLLDSLFKVYVENHHESNGVLGSLLYAQLKMRQNEFDNAFRFVSMAKSLNSIQVYFTYETRLRILETLFFAFTGDFDFASRLAHRNIRYIQLQKLSLKSYRYAHLFYLMKDFSYLRHLYPDKLPRKMQNYLREFDHGYDRLLGKLLHQLFTLHRGSDR
jgi:hypothetical protein